MFPLLLDNEIKIVIFGTLYKSLKIDCAHLNASQFCDVELVKLCSC